MDTIKKGFIPVMLTPFSEDGAVDYEALGHLTEVYLRAGASGLFANCLSSEMFELTDEERLKAIRHVMAVADGSVPVVATGTFGGPVSRQADFVKRVADTGVEAVIAITGLLAAEDENDRTLDERVMQLIMETPGIPLGFYECPVPYKRVLKPEQLERYVDTGRVIYHKDTSLDIGQVAEKIHLTGKRSRFGLYDAYMGHAIESLRAGAAGLSCIQGNYFPELIVWLCDHYADQSKAAEVNIVQQFLIDNMDVMHDVYPTVSKYFLRKRGLNISTFTRRNVGEVSRAVLRNIEQLYADYTRLSNRLELQPLF
ncbi:dihydrodipicolinate synthase family protein [Pedobacter sp. SYP-B3415]|uniref:dihydrodipicolinate synthase family protein n=1 Tax=Pedobacter sp. SYP-B3415 TaxID=2496641 RepID=UPI00101CEA7A|nr:dihydrodipicolinate synthase family protein [Pedobacter sp. SYP-B3415]